MYFINALHLVLSYQEWLRACMRMRSFVYSQNRYHTLFILLASIEETFSNRKKVKPCLLEFEIKENSIFIMINTHDSIVAFTRRQKQERKGTRGREEVTHRIPPAKQQHQNTLNRQISFKKLNQYLCYSERGKWPCLDADTARPLIDSHFIENHV